MRHMRSLMPHFHDKKKLCNPNITQYYFNPLKLYNWNDECWALNLFSDWISY